MEIEPRGLRVACGNSDRASRNAWADPPARGRAPRAPTLPAPRLLAPRRHVGARHSSHLSQQIDATDASCLKRYMPALAVGVALHVAPAGVVCSVCLACPCVGVLCVAGGGPALPLWRRVIGHIALLFARACYVFFLCRFNFYYYNIARARVAAGPWAPGRRPRGAPRAGRRVLIAETLFSNGDRQRRAGSLLIAPPARRVASPTTHRRNDACLGARYPLHGRATFRTRTATAGSQNGVGSAAHRRRAQLHSSSMRTRRSSAASTRPWA